MLKEEIIIKFNNREIFEKKVSRFGNSSHVLISKKYIGKKVKIIVGKSGIIGKKILLNFFAGAVLEGKSTKFGTAAHIILPKEYFGKKVKIIFGGKNE